MRFLGGVVFEMGVAVIGVDEAMFGCCGRKLCMCIDWKSGGDDAEALSVCDGFLKSVYLNSSNNWTERSVKHFPFTFSVLLCVASTTFDRVPYAF
jgi:hypothetical protein